MMLMNASLELLWVNKFPSSRESVPSYFRAALFFSGKNEAKRQATVIEGERWQRLIRVEQKERVRGITYST